jgi:hypothetical protein
MDMEFNAIPQMLDVLRAQTVERDGETYVVLESVCRTLGLDWTSEYLELAANPARWHAATIAVPPGDGPARSMGCLRLRKLPGWLMEIDPSRVRAEIAGWLLEFQAEGLRALQAHWDKGIATRLPAVPPPDGDVLVKQTMEAVIGDYHRRMAVVKEAEAALHAEMDAFDRRVEATLIALAHGEEPGPGGTRTVN